MYEEDIILCENYCDKKLVAKSLKERIISESLWSFKDRDVNLLTAENACFRSPHIFEIKEYMINRFLSATTEGVLTSEIMRGVHYNLLDLSYVSDAVHRGSGQVLPAMRRLYYGAQLSAAPKLMQPIFQANFEIKEYLLGEIYTYIHNCKGYIFQDTVNAYTQLCYIQAIVPYFYKDFEKLETLIITTGGTYSYHFHHWENIPGYPLTPGSEANTAMIERRQLKGLSLTIRDDYLDKL